MAKCGNAECPRGGGRILLRVEVAVTVSVGSNPHGHVDKLLHVCHLNCFMHGTLALPAQRSALPIPTHAHSIVRSSCVRRLQILFSD
jgi:hypothetical protein